MEGKQPCIRIYNVEFTTDTWTSRASQASGKCWHTWWKEWNVPGTLRFSQISALLLLRLPFTKVLEFLVSRWDTATTVLRLLGRRSFCISEEQWSAISPSIDDWHHLREQAGKCQVKKKNHFSFGGDSPEGNAPQINDNFWAHLS